MDNYKKKKEMRKIQQEMNPKADDNRSPFEEAIRLIERDVTTCFLYALNPKDEKEGYLIVKGGDLDLIGLLVASFNQNKEIAELTETALNLHKGIEIDLLNERGMLSNQS